MSLKPFAAACLAAAYLVPTALMAQTTAETTASEAESAPEITAPSASTVIARVNGEEIILGDIVALRSELPPQYQAIPDINLYDGLVDQYVSQVLLRQAAERQKLLEDPAVQRGLRIQRTSYLAELYIRGRLNEQLTKEAIEAEYARRYEGQEPPTEFNAAHILVDTEEEAKAIAEEASGGGDFTELAKAKSTGPSGPNGGNLGWFGEGQMVPPFEAAVMELEPGGISDPVQTQFGWHVILLKEKRKVEQPALSAVAEEIADDMTRKISDALIAALRENAEVEVMEDRPGLDGLRNNDLIQQ